MADRWSRNPEVIATDLGDEVVLLNPGTRAVFTLGPTGRAVWHLLAEPSDLDALVAALTSTFAVDADTARVDVSHLLDTLVDADLAQVG